MRFNPSALLAVLCIAPFTVGFSPPPEEAGTTVSVSGGTGRFISSPSGCARPRLVKFTDQQAGAVHVWKVGKKVETRIGVGADVNIFQSREKECVATDCAGGTWEGNTTQAAISPYGTLDWKWMGLSGGVHVPLQTLRGGPLDHDITRAWMPLPVRGSIRLGPLDKVYGTLALYDGRPLNSGTPHPYGLGGRLLGTDLWMGAGGWTVDDGLSASVARRFGPVGLRVAGGRSRSDVRHDDSGWDDPEPSVFTIQIPQYAWSIGLDYHLPW
jgi:hypothetical protein